MVFALAGPQTTPSGGQQQGRLPGGAPRGWCWRPEVVGAGRRLCELVAAAFSLPLIWVLPALSLKLPRRWAAATSCLWLCPNGLPA